MRDADEAIDRVLAGLRDAEAPAGMERRVVERIIVARMQREETVQRRRGWSFRESVFVWPAVATSLAVAVAVVVFVMMPEVRTSMHRSLPQQQVSLGDTPRPAGAGEQAKMKMNTQPGRLVSAIRPKRAAAARRRAGEGAAGEMSESDALALSEMHAASQPPPPLPLTEQERLLQRVAHRADPEEVAALSPERRAKKYEEERAEVHRFFVPGKTGDDE